MRRSEGTRTRTSLPPSLLGKLSHLLLGVGTIFVVRFHSFKGHILTAPATLTCPAIDARNVPHSVEVILGHVVLGVASQIMTVEFHG